MTANEKKLIIDTLVKKIVEQKSLTVLLASIKGYFETAGIDPAVYGNKLKVWLKTNFSQYFYVSNADEVFYIGTEKSEARSARVIEAILLDKLDSGERVLCAKIPDILKEYNGLRYQEFSNDMGMEEWLKTAFPSLDIHDKDLVKKLVQLTNEYVQMEKIIQTDVFLKGFTWMQKISDKAVSINEVKNDVAVSFWKALIGQNILYTKWEEDKIVSFAFDTGILSDEGNTIFAIVDRDEQTLPLKWKLLCFCCPQELVLPSAAQWLMQQIETPRKPVTEIKELIDTITEQKETTLLGVKAFEDQLNAGCVPDNAILENVYSYIDLWESLIENLSKCGFDNKNNITLNQMHELFDDNNASNDICDKILIEFSSVVDFVDKFITKNLCVSSEKTTPKQDFELFQSLLLRKNTLNDFSKFTQIINCYNDLLTAMSATSTNDIWDSLTNVWGHFTEIPSIPQLIINKPKEEYIPLLGIHSVSNLIEAYKGIIEENRPEITADRLKEDLLNEGDAFIFLLPAYLHALLPLDKTIRAIVLQKEGTDKREDFTPFSIGSRLYGAVGNKDQLAEKYFLLGLFFDSLQCGRALLSIYREKNDFESFKTVWEYTNGQTYAGEDDIVFWTLNRAETASDLSKYNGEISELLKRHPKLIENSKFYNACASVITQLSGVPDAYKQWISHASIVLNVFETAVADNNLDLIYSISDDQNEMVALGYSENEISEIRENLRSNYTTGLDDYSKGKRLFELQRNKNSAAEKYFWQSTDKNAKVDLFYIYYDAQDFYSASWIVEQYELDDGRQMRLLGAYTDSLIKISAISKLAALAVRYPEIWYCDGVLELLSTIQSPQEYKWDKLYKWSIEHPILKPNEFEKALFERDDDSAKTFIANWEQMTEWGYSAEQQKSMEQEIQTEIVYGNIKDIAKRIFFVQGNSHRFYESVLLSLIDTDRDWAISNLYQLFVFENRYNDIVAYYQAYSQIRASAEHIRSFLWGLIALEKNDLVIDCVKENYSRIGQDESLLNRIVDAAEKVGRENEISDLRRKLAITPRNRFETNLIHLNKAVLQEYISSPSSLEALGYDWDQIEKIRIAFTKLFIEGNDGYAIADRIRKFLGDERSEQFFLEAETDARSAKSLFDIYNKQKRWDDLCYLYRRHDINTTWNDHYNSLYIKALSLTTSKDNCEVYLKQLEDDLKGGVSEQTSDWIYLRALLGAERFEQAEEYEETILTENQNISIENLSSYFNLAWNHSKETKEYAVRLIDKIIKKGKLESLTPEKIQAIISANGHLVSESEDTDALKIFLRQNHLEDLEFYLNAYYGLFITDKPDEKNEFYLSLIKDIDSFEAKQINIKQLIPYFEAYKHLDSSDPLYIYYTDRLSYCFMHLAESEELFTHNDFNILLYVARIGMLSRNQIMVFLKKLIEYMDSTQENADNRMLTLFATNLILAITNNQVPNCEDEDKANLNALFCEVCDIIAGKWYIFISTTEFSGSEWSVFMSFMQIPYVEESVANELAKSWIEKMQDQMTDTALLSRLLNLLSIEKLSLSIDLCCDSLIFILNHFKTFNINEDADLLIARYIGTVAWERNQLERIIDALQRIEVFNFERITITVETILREQEPELYFKWIKQKVIFFTGDDDRQTELFPVLLECAKNQQLDIKYENDDFQLLYEAVCNNPTQANLTFLYELYKNEGRTDQASIIEAIAEDSSSDNVTVIYNWLLTVLKEREVDWIERYSKWWQGLINLTDEDQRTKSAIAFLGLSDEPINDSTLNSLSRLLMSDIYNTSYLKCYSRVMRQNSVLNEVATGKLAYFSAVADPTQLVNSIRNCFINKQFDLGIQLLLRKMEMPISNSSTAGPLLADIYTPENVRQYAKLCDYLPQIYEWIDKLNAADPQGVWKNLGRAVNIAIITDSEELLMTKLQDALFLQCPGRAAVTIASLVKKHQFSCAQKWLNTALQFNRINHYAVLEDVLSESTKTNSLSKTDELKLAMIPEDGNKQSLDFYGDFVFNAYEQGLKNECLSVMEYFFDVVQDDKAYFSTLISLYHLLPINSEHLVRLYNLAKRYFALTQEENVDRVAQMLAALHACIDFNCEEKKENVREFCMKERNKYNGYKNITDLEQDCKNLIESTDNRDTVVQIIVSAVSGHWNINDEVLTVMQRNFAESKKLVHLFPDAFCAACARAAIQNRSNKRFLTRIVDLLNEYEEKACAKSIDCVKNLTDESAARLSLLLDIPIEVPGVYFNIVKNVITKQEEQSNDKLFDTELTLLFSLQPYLNYTLYNNNKYGIKEYVEANCSDTSQSIVYRVLTRISMYALEAKGQLLHPGQYLSIQDYLMVITSAEQYKAKTSPKKTFQIEIFETYILLGKLMAGLLSPAEIKKIGLAKYVNMANLLCQNGESYKDIDTLLSYCPTKWKICVRCMQELIQGKPSNILYVMEKDSFWKVHEGCASFVEKMAKDFVSPHYNTLKETEKKKGQDSLISENRKRIKERRDVNWGTIKKEDIKSAGVAYNNFVILISVQYRNPIEISDFKSDIDNYLAEMEIDEAEKNKNKQNSNSDNSETKNESSEIVNPDNDFRKIDFVLEAIDEWRENRQDDTEKGTPEKEKDPHQIKIDSIVKDIVSNWDKPDDKLRGLCIDLGLALFNKYCERSGLKISVTDRAREILYETAKCISKNIDKKALSSVIRTDVQMCIESYSYLSELVEDCMSPALMDLCTLISDIDVRKTFTAHIEQVRQIGNLLSNPMTPAERLSELENQIKICRSSKTNIDNSLKQHLMSLINKEIGSFRDLANVTIEVYNTNGSVEEGYIFGRIQNTGNQVVKNVQMELYINDVYYKTYMLTHLEGKSMVPFALQYETDCDEGKLRYSLKANYETFDNSKEETREISGMLDLSDPEEQVYNIRAAYQTTRPAGPEDYIERNKLQLEIDKFYSPGTKFEEFPTLAIYGMRRTGKSSALKKLERTLTENFGETVLLVETSGEGATAGSLTHSVHSMLVRQVLKNKGDGYTSLKDHFVDDAEWMQFVKKWEDAPSDSDDFQWIEDFYSELSDKFLQTKKLIVLIDEVDKMYGGYEEKPEGREITSGDFDSVEYLETESEADGNQIARTNLWDIFSRITQRRTDPVRFVLCGSDYFTNSMIEGDNLTQFFQRIEKVCVGRMTRNELELAIKTLLKKDTDIEFHEDTIPYLWSVCDGLPWHAKLIVNDAISKKLNYENRNVIYPSDVMFSAGNILSNGLISTEKNFGVVALRTEERLFVSILAKKASTMNAFVSEEEIYQDFCKVIQDVDREKSFDRAKKLLVSERQLIVSREGADGPKYRFGCELYRLFNRGEKFITQQFQLR